eukprot:TRINITY_DN5119_c0_g1_i1.p1 TRINITY_DN5119_c0_g1~~TRINITY_DN5119_c0_g1_i1.p1  ORF type:complete len:928 (+),score=317.52 TRINITY_DN5119_c0_g1_i1:53-2785(+)
MAWRPPGDGGGGLALPASTSFQRSASSGKETQQAGKRSHTPRSRKRSTSTASADHGALARPTSFSRSASSRGRTAEPGQGGSSARSGSAVSRQSEGGGPPPAKPRRARVSVHRGAGTGADPPVQVHRAYPVAMGYGEVIADAVASLGADVAAGLPATLVVLESAGGADGGAAAHALGALPGVLHGGVAVAAEEAQFRMSIQECGGGAPGGGAVWYRDLLHTVPLPLDAPAPPLAAAAPRLYAAPSPAALVLRDVTSLDAFEQAAAFARVRAHGAAAGAPAPDLTLARVEVAQARPAAGERRALSYRTSVLNIVTVAAAGEARAAFRALADAAGGDDCTWDAACRKHAAGGAGFAAVGLYDALSSPHALHVLGAAGDSLLPHLTRVATLPTGSVALAQTPGGRGAPRSRPAAKWRPPPALDGHGIERGHPPAAAASSSRDADAAASALLRRVEQMVRGGAAQAAAPPPRAPALNENAGRVGELEREVLELRRLLDDAAAEAAALQAQKDAAAADAQRLQRELAAAASQCAALRGVADRGDARHAALAEDLRAAEAHAQSLRARNESLAARLDETLERRCAPDAGAAGAAVDLRDEDEAARDVQARLEAATWRQRAAEEEAQRLRARLARQEALHARQVEQFEQDLRGSAIDAKIAQLEARRLQKDLETLRAAAQAGSAGGGEPAGGSCPRRELAAAREDAAALEQELARARHEHGVAARAAQENYTAAQRGYEAEKAALAAAAAEGAKLVRDVVAKLPGHGGSSSLNTLTAWLYDLRMAKYVPLFEAHDVADLAGAAALSDAQLESMGVTYLDRKKLRDALRASPAPPKATAAQKLYAWLDRLHFRITGAPAPSTPYQLSLATYDASPTREDVARAARVATALKSRAAYEAPGEHQAASSQPREDEPPVTA